MIHKSDLYYLYYLNVIRVIWLFSSSIFQALYLLGILHEMAFLFQYLNKCSYIHRIKCDLFMRFGIADRQVYILY